MGKISNISIREFRDFLKSRGLSHSRDNGGHEIWTKEGLSRPIILQTHVEPIPEFIIKANLKTIGVTKEELIEFLEK